MMGTYVISAFIKPARLVSALLLVLVLCSPLSIFASVKVESDRLPQTLDCQDPPFWKPRHLFRKDLVSLMPAVAVQSLLSSLPKCLMPYEYDTAPYRFALGLGTLGLSIVALELIQRLYHSSNPWWKENLLAPDENRNINLVVGSTAFTSTAYIGCQLVLKMLSQ